ncbi:MAG TPA: hypothetical protein VJB87_00815 [Candidatus Nanoarchaeia archaeon]|nr:hypothetical protein [Candidatus Nanoarchaeia archaeon]
MADARSSRLDDLSSRVLGDSSLQSLAQVTPHMADIVRRETAKVYGQYGRVLEVGQLLDRADIISSIAGLGLDTTVFPGFVLEALELVPKIAYGCWYIAKTKDVAAIPHWLLMESASFVPIAGEFVDLHFTYRNRARSFIVGEIVAATKRSLGVAS